LKHKIISATVLVALSALSGQAAARSTLGGIVFTDFYYQSIENDLIPNADDITRVKVELPNMSRLRGRWTNEDGLTMYVEYGMGGRSAASGTNLRHAWGKWDYSQTGQIMAGHSSSPFSPLFPNQTIGNNASESHNVGKGYGEVSSGRAPQIRYTYKFLNQRGALAVAILDPNRDDNIDSDIAGDKSSDIPRIDIGMAYRAYNWQFFPSVFFQESEYTNQAIGDDSVTSWGASLGVKGAFSDWVVSGEVNYGQNMRNANLSIGQSAAAQGSGAYLYTDGDGVTRIADTDNLSGWIDVGYRFETGEMRGTVHFVAGYMESDRSDTGDLTLDLTYESTMFGVSVPIDLPRVAKGFRVRPEIFYYENDNDGSTDVLNDGSEVLAGVQLQYTF